MLCYGSLSGTSQFLHLCLTIILVSLPRPSVPGALQKDLSGPSFFLSPFCLLTCCLCLPPQAGFSPLCPPSAHSVTLGTWALAKSSHRPLDKAGSFCGIHPRADLSNQEDLREDLIKAGHGALGWTQILEEFTILLPGYLHILVRDIAEKQN